MQRTQTCWQRKVQTRHHQMSEKSTEPTQDHSLHDAHVSSSDCCICRRPGHYKSAAAAVAGARAAGPADGPGCPRRAAAGRRGEHRDAAAGGGPRRAASKLLAGQLQKFTLRLLRQFQYLRWLWRRGWAIGSVYGAGALVGLGCYPGAFEVGSRRPTSCADSCAVLIATRGAIPFLSTLSFILSLGLGRG